MNSKRAYKVISCMLLNGGTAVTLDTKSKGLYKGKKLKDNKGRTYTVNTVGMCNDRGITIIALNELFNGTVLYDF